MTPESKIKAACLQYMKKRGIKAWNNPTGAVRITPNRWLHFGLKGSTDILGLLPGGRFLAVETKSTRGKLSPEQREFLADINTLGGMAIVARSWQDIDKALREAGYVNDGPLFETCLIKYLGIPSITQSEAANVLKNLLYTTWGEIMQMDEDGEFPACMKLFVKTLLYETNCKTVEELLCQCHL
jgi:hypothetical protein